MIHRRAGRQGCDDRLGHAVQRHHPIGDTTLEYGEGTGYLPSLLQHLNINVDSQTLVFSKTSFQQAIISPTTVTAPTLDVIPGPSIRNRIPYEGVENIG